MSRWKLTIEYDGSAFCGWQKQPRCPSVQQTIEEAIAKFVGEAPALHVAGRTDTGVHARAQVAHFDCDKSTTANTVRDAINHYLMAHKISILNAEEVDTTFHARFSALRRSYRYRIVNRRPPLALLAGYALHIKKPLDAALMQKAADRLIGKHDFSTFRASNCQANSPIRTLERLDVARDGDEIVIYADARSFLYHQVRNIVGTLCYVGTAYWSLDDFQKAFEACDRTKGGPTAPPDGLYFWEVSYPQK